MHDAHSVACAPTEAVLTTARHSFAQEYGHPWGLYDEPLVRVPWLECPYDDRRTITRGSAGETEAADADVVTERLRDLGYVS